VESKIDTDPCVGSRAVLQKGICRAFDEVRTSVASDLYITSMSLSVERAHAISATRQGPRNPPSRVTVGASAVTAITSWADR
jgi:hypothetical protein